MSVHEYIKDIKCLVSFTRNSEALTLLQHLASLVKPIMSKRGWKVKRLKEFFPKNPSLLGLNINRGSEIRIRLRPASDKTVFLDCNDLIGTLLHEYASC